LIIPVIWIDVILVRQAVYVPDTVVPFKRTDEQLFHAANRSARKDQS
jgi:hypothetical protein